VCIVAIINEIFFYLFILAHVLLIYNTLGLLRVHHSQLLFSPVYLHIPSRKCLQAQMDPIFCLYRQDTPLFFFFVPAWRGFHNPSKPLPLQDIFVRLFPESEPLRGGLKDKVSIMPLKDKIDNDDDVK